MKKSQTYLALVLILLAAFFLRTYRLLDFPLFGDEVDEGDIALEMLRGHLALYYPQNEGNEPLYQFTMTPFFAILGDSVIANRFPSVAWSMVFVALMYAYGRILFRSRRMGALCAALAASLWWTTLFGRLGLREISQPTLMIPALVALVLILRDANPTRATRAAFSGAICAGLTTYTFLSGRGFPIIIVFFLAFMALAQRAALKQHAREFAIYCVLMLAISAPLWVYLGLHPELDFHVRDLAGRSWLGQRDFGMFAAQLSDTLGMFTMRGDLNWAHNLAGRPVFPGIEGWIFYAGMALCLWRWRKPEYAMQLIVLAVMLVPNMLAENPPRWTRSIGILPGLIAMTVVPVESVWARLARFSRTQVVYGALFALLGVSIYARTAFDFFDQWIDHPGVYWMTLAFYDSAGKYIHQSPDTTPVNYVMESNDDWRQHNVTRVAARSDVEIRFSARNAFVFPNDPRGTRIAFQIFERPSRALELAFLDLEHPLYIDPRTDPAGNRPLRIYSVPPARLAERLALAQSSAVFIPGTATRVQKLRVDDTLRFEGYEILNPAAQPGEILAALSYWRVLRPLPDLAVFMHLLDPNGRIVAQFDGFDAASADLKPNDLVVQFHPLVLPTDLPNALYRLELGAYTRRDGKRLPLDSGDDHVWLQTWTPGK